MTHLVIFDIDDTLLHSMDADDRLYRKAIVDTVGPVRFRESLADYDHVSDMGILLQVLDDNGMDPLDSVIARIRGSFLDALQAFVDTNGPFREVDGARSVIRRLRSSDRHAIALATGCWRASAELKLSTAGFDVDGVPLASADDATERVSIMRTALAHLASEPASITYYGDGIWDQRACAELGWRFRPVGPGLGGIESFAGEFSDL